MDNLEYLATEITKMEIEKKKRAKHLSVNGLSVEQIADIYKEVYDKLQAHFKTEQT